MFDLIRRQEAVEIIYKALKTPVPDYSKDPFHDTMGLACAMADEIPSADAIELGVEYNTKDYTIKATTNYEEREIDESHSKLLVRGQTFRVEKNE